MEVILSTGQGRLHFVETAEALRSAGITPTVLTGWVPLRMPKSFVDALGPLVGRDRLHQRLSVRRRIYDAGCPVKALAWPEAYMQMRYALSRTGLDDQSKASAAGWKAFGRASIPHLKGDIFHVRSGAGQGGAIAAAKARGMKVIVDQSLAHPAAMERNLRRVYEKHELHFNLSANDTFWKLVLKDCDEADCLLVNSDYVKQTFVDEGYPAEKIVVEHLGMRSDFVGLKQNYSIPDDRPLRLLFTGGFALRKGCDVLIEAMRLLDEAGVECELVVAGHAEQGKRVLNAKAPHLKEKFKFHGFLPQEQLKALLREADCYVFPSYAEGCAKSAMEALAAGLPVICTEETGLPEIEPALYHRVPRGDAGALVQAIQTVATDANIQSSLGQASCAYIKNQMQWTTYGQILKNIYNGLIKGQNHGA
jgi:glycosyltransferase involved in cell wall biosynthesis